MRAGAFCFITGLVVTLAGVGGIEHSDLVSGLIVAATGLSVMFAGTVLIHRSSR